MRELSASAAGLTIPPHREVLYEAVPEAAKSDAPDTDKSD